MTEIQKENKIKVLDRDNYRCQKCLKWPEFSIAHRIANTKVNRHYFGSRIIDHPFNQVVSCSRCNDSYNIGNNPGKCKRLIELIDRIGNEPVNEALVLFINDYLEK